MLLDFDRLGALRAVLIVIALLVGAFLMLPILTIAALFFGSSRYLQFPPPAWTTKDRPSCSKATNGCQHPASRFIPSRIKSFLSPKVD